MTQKKKVQVAKKVLPKRLVKVINLTQKGEDIHVNWHNAVSGERLQIQDGATVKLSNTVIEILKAAGETVYEAQTIKEGETFKSKFVPNYYIIELGEPERDNSQTPAQKDQAHLAEALLNEGN